MEQLEQRLRARLENTPAVKALPSSSESKLDAVEPGTCTVNEFGASSLTRTTRVDCDEPHKYELFAAFTGPETGRRGLPRL